MNFENSTSLKDSKKYINVCTSKLGTKAIRCTDESFAAKERMLSETEPIFKNNVYDNYGQWMDGWETKRRRTAGFDWCIIRLGVLHISQAITHFKHPCGDLQKKESQVIMKRIGK